jgi:hypothetical protein
MCADARRLATHAGRADFARVSQACGEGSNGECYVVHRRAAASAPQLCVKVPRNGSTSDMQEEVDLMRKLGDCEYIVQFVAYYREGEGANLRQHIVMEARQLALCACSCAHCASVADTTLCTCVAAHGGR